MQTIVFDDLTQYGYRLASRQDGLDEVHCKVTLEKLGKFHAASMVMAQQVSERKNFNFNNTRYHCPIRMR